MPLKTRSRAFRREQMTRDKAKRRKPAAPKPARNEAYDRNKRVANRAALRDTGMWL